MSQKNRKIQEEAKSIPFSPSVRKHVEKIKGKMGSPVVVSDAKPRRVRNQRIQEEVIKSKKFDCVCAVCKKWETERGYCWDSPDEDGFCNLFVLLSNKELLEYIVLNPHFERGKITG